MTAEEFDKICFDVCPSCKNGVKLRQRDDTKEWVHDVYRGNTVSHSFCLASNFRNKHKDSLDG